VRYLSVCSGIEAATVAWPGWEPVAFSEIEKFPCSLLAHHYPNVPNWGDMNEFRQWPDADIDVLVGGTPCQSFSVAGLRAGLADPRGNLALVYLAIAERYRPAWLVWENVPGVLSSDGGRDFGAIIGGMVELGYCPSWRVLDAQYFGVAQRRRRVFVVASFGDWRPAAEVLFEPESLRGHPPPSRETGEGTAPSPENGAGIGRELVPETVGALTDGAHCGGGLNGQDAYSGRIFPVAFNWQNGGGYGNAHEGLGISEDHAGPMSRSQVQAVAFKPSHYTRGTTGGAPSEVIPTLLAGAKKGDQEPVIAYGLRAEAAEPGAKQQTHVFQEKADCLTSAYATKWNGNGSSNNGSLFAYVFKQGKGDDAPAVATSMAVRRLTPRECERLQGFPDDYTLIPGANDSARYKALGNSMAVPVMSWLGRRIDYVSDKL